MEESKQPGPYDALPLYRCHKQVRALKIAGIEHKPNPEESGRSAATSYGAVITPWEDGFEPFEVDASYIGKHNPQPGGYFVAYDDGYTSYSPSKAFEEGYSPLPA